MNISAIQKIHQKKTKLFTRKLNWIAEQGSELFLLWRGYAEDKKKPARNRTGFSMKTSKKFSYKKRQLEWCQRW